MTIEQIKQALYVLDLKLRPQVIFIHPDEYDVILQGIPDIENKVKLISTKAVDKGCAIMIDRHWLES